MDNNFKVNIELVMELRKKYGVKPKECLRAMKEAKNDIKKAEAILLKKNNITDDSTIKMLVKGEQLTIILQAGAVTDFVSKHSDLQACLHEIAKIILKAGVSDVDAALKLNFNDEKTIAKIINDKTRSFGERIEIEKFAIIEKKAQQFFGFYNHNGDKTAVVVVEISAANCENINELARDLAIQTVDSQPLFIDETAIANSKKQEIYEQIKQEVINESDNKNKPETIISKIVDGRFKKFLKETTLINSKWFRNNEKTVQQILTEKQLKVKKMLIYIAR